MKPIEVVIMPAGVKDPGDQEGVDISSVGFHVNAFHGVSTNVSAEVEKLQGAYESTIDKQGSKR